MHSLKAISRKLLQRKAGFTLVELLVVIGIIVALGAVIVPNVLRFANSGEQGAMAAESDAVQAAMDAMMADVGVVAVTALVGPATSSGLWTALPAEGSLDLYLRETITTFFYCWDTTGLITQQDTATLVCP